MNIILLHLQRRFFLLQTTLIVKWLKSMNQKRKKEISIFTMTQNDNHHIIASLYLSKNYSIVTNIFFC